MKTIHQENSKSTLPISWHVKHGVDHSRKYSRDGFQQE